MTKTCEKTKFIYFKYADKQTPAMFFMYGSGVDSA